MMLRDIDLGGEAQKRAAEEWLAQAPKIDPDYRVYWTGFQTLTSCRSFGMAVGPIPWTAIKDYTLFYSFTEDEAYRFVEIVMAIDNQYMKLVHQKEGEQTR